MSRKHGWHFANEDFKLRYGDNRLIEPGVTFTVDCKSILCEQGLHDSIRAIDALDYAPGPVVSRTVLSGEVIEGKDKRVGTKRTHLWVYDASEELKAFARWCALEVIDLWDAPDVVREYLETRNESLSITANAAARTASDVTSDAVWYAARTACAAASAAASDAASDAAWYAASNARDAVWYAARTASDVASDAVWYEMCDKQNKKLEQILKDGWKQRKNS